MPPTSVRALVRDSAAPISASLGLGARTDQVVDNLHAALVQQRIQCQIARIEKRIWPGLRTGREGQAVPRAQMNLQPRDLMLVEFR